MPQRVKTSASFTPNLDFVLQYWNGVRYRFSQSLTQLSGSLAGTNFTQNTILLLRHQRDGGAARDNDGLMTTPFGAVAAATRQTNRALRRAVVKPRGRQGCRPPTDITSQGTGW